MDPQPVSPGADQADATPSAQADEPQPQETESGWFRRTIARLTGRSEPEPEDAPPAGEAAAAGDGTPKVVTLTEEELAERERRAAQSGRDRALYELRQPRQKTRAEQRAEELALLDQNPWEAGDKRKQELLEEEEREKQQQVLFGVVQVADQAMLDPVLTRLPEREWRALLAEHQDALSSFQGRQALVSAALERIETQSLEKAKATLRSTKTAEGRAFRKELLAEFRGGLPEPELVQPGARSAGSNGHVSENGFMNSALRRAANRALAARERDDDSDLDDDT